MNFNLENIIGTWAMLQPGWYTFKILHSLTSDYTKNLNAQEDRREAIYLILPMPLDMIYLIGSGAYELYSKKK